MVVRGMHITKMMKIVYINISVKHGVSGFQIISELQQILKL